MILTLLLLQAAAQQAPDIELNATVRARRVTIEKQGEASLTVKGGPDSIVDVRAPKANGRKTLNNVEVRVRAEARIADPAQAPKNNGPETETGTPQ
jgi:hypothetical protein